ncbi:elongation of fatty acids protein 3-like [Canna indica]|uniref:Elongation of fatty acids protein 3-like n=1 Tax=Canna indica TaxID=4628 RepID=A0AAQ3PWG2_9LILI|nr:elongation of fatty acids protein 3-like [Canna indica]
MRREMRGSNGGITYWMAEHPAIVGFRWSHAQSWGSTWSFLVASLSIYAVLALALHLLLRVLLPRRRRPLPLGPLPALHSLAMALSSSAIFLGLLLSAVAEIRDTRWSWRGRSRSSPLQWLLCFPLGTRPSGRVFFWSYVFYLSRFLHLLRTFINILRRRPRAAIDGVFRHSALVCMSFLWLEFSQSFQVVAILSASLAHAVVFSYRFWVGVGLPAAARTGAALVLACQVALTGCNLVCHLGVLLLHFAKGGCNGIGAWVFNSVLNAALLFLFVHFVVKRVVRIQKGESLEDNSGSSHHSSSHHHHQNKADSFDAKKER